VGRSDVKIGSHRRALGMAAAIIAWGCFACSSTAPAKPLCHGKAHRRNAHTATFKFTCGAGEPDGFRVKANRDLSHLEDENQTYNCDRRGPKRFTCNLDYGNEPALVVVERKSGHVCQKGKKLRLTVVAFWTDGADHITHTEPVALTGPCG
jgi:hypothetical protein